MPDPIATNCGDVRLRPPTAADLPIFFQHEQDPAALHMAAFTPRDPADHAAFMAHWQRIMASQHVVIRTILVAGQVAGHVLSYADGERWEISYWLGREYWGRGLATCTLAAFLEEFTHRPLYGRAAADNRPSIRVMEKCGFVVIGQERGFANARGADIDELVLRLD